VLHPVPSNDEKLAAYWYRRASYMLISAAACSWILLTILSVVPGRHRPHTGASGNIEHIVAYLLAALVTKLAFPRLSGLRQIIAFSSASAFFEFCQIWIQGRSPGLDNWAASTFGAAIGILLAQAFVARVLMPSNPR